jgi:hypothetical protein
MSEAEEQEQGQGVKTEEEKEYEAGFSAAVEGGKDKGLPHPHPDPLPEGEGEKGEEQAPKETVQVAEETKGIEKALKDTKAHATKLSQENSQLKRKLEAFEKGEATRAEVDAAKKAVQEAKDNLDEAKGRIYSEYPELKEVLDPLIETTRSLKREVETFKNAKAQDAERERRQTALDHFNANVKPRVMETHPDFDSIVKDPNYWSWAEAQRPALRTAAMDSPDPEDIRWALTEFKRFKASDEAKAVRQKDEKDKQTKLLNAMSIRGGGGAPAGGGKKGDPEDYDAGFALGSKG